MTFTLGIVLFADLPIKPRKWKQPCVRLHGRQGYLGQQLPSFTSHTVNENMRTGSSTACILSRWFNVEQRPTVPLHHVPHWKHLRFKNSFGTAKKKKATMHKFSPISLCKHELNMDVTKVERKTPWTLNPTDRITGHQEILRVGEKFFSREKSRNYVFNTKWSSLTTYIQ